MNHRQHFYVLLAILATVSLLAMMRENREGFGVDDHFPRERTICANKKQCYDRYSVRWESDPDMFKQRDIVVNPFGKHPGSHCRGQNFQCASNKCDKWFCK